MRNFITPRFSRRTLRSVLASASVLALFALSSSAPSAAPATTQVDLKLVLATDVSGSINDEEAELQRLGTAEAFMDPEVIKSIQNGALGRIAVAMLDFSSPEYDKVIIDWHIIKDKASANAFAELVRGSPRSPGRRTSVSSALELGSTLIESSAADIVATRRVIDVSGDGPNNDGNPMREVHDRVIGQGIIVNGLPVMDDNANGYYPGLDKYYAACVAGGRGSFVVVVHSFKDFGAAMRHKLILEVSGIDPATKFAKTVPPKNPLLTKVAASDGPPAQPQVLRPGQNEFSDHCDIAGGFGGFNRF
ncbi:MAG TPA: DUF1194 domain-containing protein [Micropepsaceae bacterium]|nr:DUF1194 domain-containing protein [Micropepsaceae bacterium]